MAGIDHSGQMVGMAERANARLVAQGRVDVRLGDSSALPWRDRSFDKAFSVNTLYFWKNPCGDLGELLRVLKPGGRLVVGFRYDGKAVRDFPEPFYRFWPPETVVSMLGGSRFRGDPRVREQDRCACVLLDRGRSSVTLTKPRRCPVTGLAAPGV